MASFFISHIKHYYMIAALNTNNQEYITWQYEQLQFALLGGLKIDGLERMRVTLKVEYKQQAIRHNLDLYNNESVDKLVKRCAERFALGTAYIATAFAILINQLEAYRLEQFKTLAVEKETVKQLSETVIGEENNRLLMYLVFTSRN
jgi:hypothetical protein